MFPETRGGFSYFSKQITDILQFKEEKKQLQSLNFNKLFSSKCITCFLSFLSRCRHVLSEKPFWLKMITVFAMFSRWQSILRGDRKMFPHIEDTREGLNIWNLESRKAGVGGRGWRYWASAVTSRLVFTRAHFNSYGHRGRTQF